MGTHPIFESDFDCLTDFGLKKLKMTASLQWAIINKFNSRDIRKSGITWSKEAGHLKGKKSFKYSTLVNPGAVTVAANADGGVVLTTTGNKNANLPAKNTTSVVIKKNSRATFKSIRNTVRANNFRKDQKRAAVKKASAILRSQARK